MQTDTKILTLDELASFVSEQRRDGRRVVLCHGVFDLIHPGHIRHLDAARREGDILVVTITPDEHVGKGPGRPVFNERLRSEAIAALASVDAVAVNRWPTAVETIRLLHPDVYVKGGDYERREDDLTGMIVEEERAVVDGGGRIHFTHDITFSASSLLNAHFDVFSPEATSFLREFRTRYSGDDVIQQLRSIRDLKILVVGDAIIDEYFFCRAYGMASKSASIAAQLLREEHHAGGALAVANHLAGFCDHVELVTCLGALDSREALIREQLKANVDASFHVRPDAPTTAKRRYVHNFLLMKMFEITRFNDTALPEELEVRVVEDLERRMQAADVVVAADFGQGFIGSRIVASLTKNAKFLAVNAQTNAVNYGYNLVTRYPRADYVCIDAEEAHLAYRDRNAPIADVMEYIAGELSPQTLAVTRGQHGSSVRAKSGATAHVPPFSRDVVDTTGAGDAYLALTSPLAALGCEPEVLGFVGNAVGALAVRVVGNKEPVDSLPLFRFVTSLLK